MEDTGEETVAEDSHLVVERIKNGMGDMKPLNGLKTTKDIPIDLDSRETNNIPVDLDGKETDNHMKQNGDVHVDTDSKDSISIDIEPEACTEGNEHMGNVDTCSDGKVSPVDSEKTELNGKGEQDTDSQLSKADVEVQDEIKCENDNSESKSSTEHSIDSSDIEMVDTQVEETMGTQKEEVTVKEPDKTENEEKSVKTFMLNDKIRNSLKGLQNKVKSTPEKKPCDSEQDKTNGKYFESDSDIVEMSSTDKDKEETDTVDSASDSNKPSNSIEKDNNQADEDDVLLGVGSEGTPMEIGSDDDDGNEDDLLELSDDSTKNFQKETKCNSVKTNLSIFNDKVQFDEDSNSNSTNTGKINDIVNFLNTDISSSKSPLTVNQSDTQKNDKSDTDEVTIIDDETPDKSEADEEKVDENETAKEPETVSESINEVEDKLIEVCNEKEKESDDISNRDNTKQEASKDDEDDDDDVIICESETKPESTNSVSEDKSVSNNELETTSSNKTEPVQKPDENTASSMEEEEDDDVIFEKEVKPSAGPDGEKPNCDTIKTSNKSDTDEDISKDISKDSEEQLETKTTEADHHSPKDDSKEASEEPIIEEIQDTDSDSKSQSDRKRRAESDSSVCEGESKRSRLDLSGLIGKLGDRVQPTSIEVTDSDEEEEEALETETAESEVEAEVIKDESDAETQKFIKVTEKELESLVREKVKSYLTTQRDSLIVQLSQKVKELQANNDLWKRQVKDLQTKVNDVTVLQQKLESRKAKTDALRQITKRSVGLQVDDGRDITDCRILTSSGANPTLREKLAQKIMSPTTPPRSSPHPQNTRTGSGSNKSPKMQLAPPEPQKPQKPMVNMLHSPVPIVTAPPGANGTIRLPIPNSSHPQLSQQISQAPMGVVYRAPSVKSLLDNTRMQPTVSSASVAVPTTTPTSVINIVQMSPRLMSQPGSTQGYISVPQSTITQAVSKVATKGVATAGGNVTTIDLTDDDDASKTRVVTLPAGLSPINPQIPGMRTVLPPGTQIIRQAMPNSQTQYQLVFNSSSPSLRPQAVMTSSIPQTGTILQSLPQSNMVTLTSPAGVAPGSTVARVPAPIVQLASGPAAQTVTQKVQPPPPAVPTHPAPFPALPANQAAISNKLLPPKPTLKISRVSQGIVLSWNMSSVQDGASAEISNYQLFAYQETSAPPSTTLWKKVGDVKALPLPMACTLTQFQVGNKYHFAVRAMDAHSRVGHFSDPSSILLTALPATSSK